MKNLYSDTIVAPATTPGTGAISIVRVSGPDAFRIADAVVQLKRGNISSSEGYKIHFGKVFCGGALLDEVLVSVFRAPHSYTGEDAVEISTHASSYIVSELLRLLLAAGARMAQPGEFTRRAFLNGKMDLAQAEAVADVIASTTSAAHRVAMNQFKGSFSARLESLRSELLEMASLLELELDFSEEDVEFADRGKLLSLVEGTLSHVRELADSFHRGNLIKSGVPVAIVGPANAGKSTLLNTLVGEERAIVSDIPGTTRDSIEEVLNLDGILFRFIDTAGIRDSSDTVERMGIDRTFRKISEAEIVLGVLDINSDESDLLTNLDLLVKHVNFREQKVVLLLNKCDSVVGYGDNKNVISSNKYVSSLGVQIDIINISAKTGLGIGELKQTLLRLEQDLLPDENSTFITNLRHYEALTETASCLEICRTSLSRRLPQELVAEDLRRSIGCINTILGTDLLDPETILHSIFSRHCIGK